MPAIEENAPRDEQESPQINNIGAIVEQSQVVSFSHAAERIGFIDANRRFVVQSAQQSQNSQYEEYFSSLPLGIIATQYCSSIIVFEAAFVGKQ